MFLKVLCFNGILTKINAWNRSGLTVENRIKLACSSFLASSQLERLQRSVQSITNTPWWIYHSICWIYYVCRNKIHRKFFLFLKMCQTFLQHDDKSNDSMPVNNRWTVNKMYLSKKKKKKSVHTNVKIGIVALASNFASRQGRVREISPALTYHNKNGGTDHYYTGPLTHDFSNITCHISAKCYLLS